MLATCILESGYLTGDVIADVREIGDAILKESSLEEEGDCGKTEEMLKSMKLKGPRKIALQGIDVKQMEILLTPSPLPDSAR